MSLPALSELARIFDLELDLGALGVEGGEPALPKPNPRLVEEEIEAEELEAILEIELFDEVVERVEGLL